ncbi:Oidioi.mRNA.OKI2018_I69.XSR.g15261.t2.cds [Oikopleura dioica]|uniref:Oidioi.mRNA.OKI2018_I69.XSR.g15261.t2.cds n=1 Tax=Oikopleura dioica TaxID=34765 RepID=A0ABN7SCA6_OIKDI|nr:Oidioi.mRNA.OKI2018_I69.XSR.g15261.t2.cds [Oikopleura dioica]
MKSALGLLLNVDALGVLGDYLSLLNAKTQMEAVNTQFAHGLDEDQRAEQLLSANYLSPNLGQSVASIFSSGIVSPSSANKFYMTGMKNQALAEIQSLSPYTDLLFAYAQAQKNTDQSTQEITQEEVLYSSILEEPMRTIMLLRKSENTKIRAHGQTLLKKAAARCLHLASGPKRDNCKQTNPLPNALMDLVVDGDSTGSKNFLLSSLLKEPTSAVVLNRLINDLDISSAVNSNKELLFLRLLGAGASSPDTPTSLDQIAPNDAYLMFKLIEDHSESNSHFPTDLILSLAYGNDVLDIEATSFQETFGVSTSNFICAVHEESLRLPCLVNQDTITAGECISQGCCYNELDESGVKLALTTKTPKCYKNILGKVGIGIARHMIKKEHIIDLFGGVDKLPTLNDLTEASNWAQSQMPDVLRRMVKEPGDYAGAPENHKMWNDVFDSTENLFKIHDVVDDFPGRDDFVWKPHGPTAMPGAANIEIPEVGGFLSGSDERVKKLDFWVSSHANNIRAQLNSNSYTCQLIEPENMSACFPQNYAALNFEDPAGECEAIGCCFNELNLFHKDGPLPVCYRSLRAGFCDIDISERNKFEDGTNGIFDDGYLENKFWKNTPNRTPCGDPAMDRYECLSQHPTCCFDPNPRVEGEAFCYRRGGAESRIDPKTNKASEGELDECLIIPPHQREGCFNPSTKHGELLNRIATVEQCDAMGCCFDGEAAISNKKLPLFGLTLAGPHCYAGPSNLDRAFINSNYNDLQRRRPSELQRVCANSPKWPKLFVQVTVTQYTNAIIAEALESILAIFVGQFAERDRKKRDMVSDRKLGNLVHCSSFSAIFAKFDKKRFRDIGKCAIEKTHDAAFEVKARIKNRNQRQHFEPLTGGEDGEDDVDEIESSIFSSTARTESQISSTSSSSQMSRDEEIRAIQERSNQLGRLAKQTDRAQLRSNIRARYGLEPDMLDQERVLITIDNGVSLIESIGDSRELNKSVCYWLENDHVKGSTGCVC